MPMFSPVPTKIGDLLNSDSQFAIPVYQREYKWGKEEALELIEDISGYVSAKDDNLFLGNLIFERARDKKTYVVDGQQRLTTIFILLAACRVWAKTLKLTLLEPRIQEKLTFMDPTTGESLGCRLIASESVREVLDNMAQQIWDGNFDNLVGKKGLKRKISKVKPIYDEFLKAVSELSATELSDFLRALYNSYVARIEVESEVEALSIFERTNARGLDLEVSDLLKNFLFSKKVDAIESHWELILDNSGGTLLRMLKYFYVSKKGHVVKSQLYKRLKTYGADDPQDLTQQLLQFSRFYNVVKNPEKLLTKTFFEDEGFVQITQDQYRYEKINRALEALKEFGVVQFCPTMFAGIECVARNSGKASPADAKKLIELFEAFEKYHFINNVICERVGNEVEKLYAETCVHYSKSPNFVQTTDRLINEMKAKLATEEEFVANFVNLNYSQDQISLLSYIFDRFNNYNLDPGQSVQIYNPDPKLRRRNHTIEHFLAQNPDPESKIKKGDLDFKDNIGNLLAIYFRENAHLGNSTPVEKIEKLRGPLRQKVENLKYVTEFVDTYGSMADRWGAALIQERARTMAVKAYRDIWKIR
jgi:uncharacterized protein with ParB-like and HNH nuclease domain